MIKEAIHFSWSDIERLILDHLWDKAPSITAFTSIEGKKKVFTRSGNGISMSWPLVWTPLNKKPDSQGGTK